MITDKSDLPELPEGWVWTRVGEIYDIVGGGTPSTTVVDYWEGNIPWITSADIHGLKDIKPRRKITKKAIENSATNLVPENSLVVVTRVGLGKIALTKVPLCFSQDCQALVGNNSLINPNYSLYYLFQTIQIFKYKHRGTTINGVPKSQLASLSFILPPLPEQHRIVNKIEELFTKLDAGVSSLEKVKAQLKRYRQAVLKYAFEGKLTEEWREAHRNELEPASALLERIKKERRAEGKHKELPPLDASDLPELPKGWVWTKLGEIIQPSNEKANPLKIPKMLYIGLEHIEKDTGKLLGYGYSSETRSTKSRFYPGDLLYGKLRPYLNKVYLADFGGICSTDILVFPNSPHISNKYLKFRFLYNDFVGYANQNMSGVQHPRINFNALSQFIIALPPLPEQHRIVSEIERRLSVADEVEKTVEQSLKQAERLRQSILKKAFEGKLVPQDPTDEPASVLLERIKEERRKHESMNKKRGEGKKSGVTTLNDFGRV